MTKPMAAVLADAVRLDNDARAALAAELLASLDGPADPDAESAWAAAIVKRAWRTIVPRGIAHEH